MDAVREAAVAGLFYPDEPAQLRRAVTCMLTQDRAPAPSWNPRALIVPHAGYVYSGEVAAGAYRLLTPVRERIHRVALLGPAHRMRLKGMALPTASAFETPLGRVPLDRAGMARIADQPGVVDADEAHRFEHALEVQLPFLQVMLGSFTMVPLVVGDCPPPSIAAVVDALAEDPDTLFVLSSDLSHFLGYEQARRIDRATGEKILARSTSLTDREACGASVINGFMCSRTAATLAVEMVDLRNSGDTTGEGARVVGYASFILH